LKYSFSSLPRVILFAAGILLSPGCYAQQNPARVLDKMLDVKDSYVYIVAHRGDWRDAPENSVEALQDAQKLGADAVELDLKRSRDGELVVMHDPTVDRTTTGRGPVSTYSLSDLKRLKLRAATGHPTAHTIPTFEEELQAAKGQMVLDIDQGWDFFPDVLRTVRSTGTVDQVMVNAKPNTTLDEFERTQGPVPDDVTLMIIVDLARPSASEIVRSFSRHKRTIVQFIFAHDEDMIKATEVISERPVFVNSLWSELCGGHDDDRAVEFHQEDATWGWLAQHQVTLLQTDRLRESLQYFREKRLLTTDRQKSEMKEVAGRQSRKYKPAN
jgi:glycerophosphoryl diester phosphodiesterase